MVHWRHKGKISFSGNPCTAIFVHNLTHLRGYVPGGPSLPLYSPRRSPEEAGDETAGLAPLGIIDEHDGDR
jgi:hypothetical protein